MEPTVPPAERGATRIAERVVAKLAVQAAREVLATSEGAPMPDRRVEPPHATAALRRLTGGDGGMARASVRVGVELGYPSDIGAQCAAVRRHVALRIKELTGIDASEVAVDVERLHSVHFDGTRPAAGRVR